jgi:hypothetical protein
MEVHAHTHTDSHRKSWTHYFWEFFMMFLAVFCGFLAENQREHFVENNRAKEYAVLLMEDLKNDSVYISQLTTNQTMMLLRADSLLAILSSDQFMNNNFKIIYLFNHIGTLVDFKPAFRVNFEQIKNSGSLRYFKNKKLVSLLSEFDRLLETTAEVYKGYNDFILQNFTPFAINHLNTLQYDIATRTVLVSHPDIYGWDKKESILLANKVNLKKTYDVFFISYFLKKCMEQTSSLIIKIKNEYHLV